MGVGYQRKEGQSISYIIEGDGMVYNHKNGGILLRLGKGHIFGESEMTK